MKSVTVWPVEGRLILMPERDFAPVPTTGAKVYLTSFYARAIQHGDLTTTDPAAAKPSATPVAPLTTSGPSAV
jgi:hypothetical protein